MGAGPRVPHDERPTDLNLYRRTVLQARIDRARRLLALIESNSRSNAESVIELRRFAEIMGVDSDQGRDALEFADRMERGDVKSLAAIRASVATEVQTVQAELDRSTSSVETQAPVYRQSGL